MKPWVPSTWAGDLRGLLMVARRSQGNWRWEGPLGTPLGLVHWIASNPLPASFYGWYTQAAYNFNIGGYRLAPFARYEKYDMGASYEGLAPGFSPTPAGATPNGAFPSPRDTVYTVGANFYLNPNVVFKFDVQRFRTNSDFNRVDLGLGLAF